MIAFVKGWYEHRHVPSDFLLVRYEDLHHDPAAELRRILAFVGLNVSDEIIEASVDYASFDNLRKMSLSAKFPRLSPTNLQDPESFKVRRGEVGGYRRYLSIPDVEYINERMHRELPSCFGYAGLGT
jgi:hypothetical protein